MALIHAAARQARRYDGHPPYASPRGFLQRIGHLLRGPVLGQPLPEGGAGHRTGKEIALEVGAAETDQQVTLLDGLYPFGQRIHAHHVRYLDNLAQQAARTLLLDGFVNEAPVDLEFRTGSARSVDREE